MMAKVLDCGHEPTDTDAAGTGYGRNRDGLRLCYECMAVVERLSMIKTGKACLYLCGIGEPFGLETPGPEELTNWPGSLTFPIERWRKGRHNLGGVRYDVWFTGPDGAPWWGTCYGENTQLTHCRRIKKGA